MKPLLNPLRRLPRRVTLVEMMLCLTILAAIAGSYLYGFSFSNRMTEATIYDTTASIIAQGYIEQIKTIPYGELLTIMADTNPSFRIATPTLAGPSSTIQMDTIPIGQVTELQVPIDRRRGQPVLMTMRIRPTVTNLFVTNTPPIPAMEVIIQYIYENQARPSASSWVNGRQVQYVIPNLQPSLN